MNLSIPLSIYIVSTGRSGTTVLAKALSGHPELVMRSHFPYENRTSQHLFTWGMNGREAEMPYLIEDKESSVKYRLYQKDDDFPKQWFKDNANLVKKYRAIEVADKFYECVAQLENKTSPKAYVEKSIGMGTITKMHKWGWPLKRILLVRDPRDILLSVNAFNKKHSMSGFGADKFDDRELLQRYIQYFLHNRNIMGEIGMSGVEVRYEDLLANPKNELKRVASELDLDDSDASISNMFDTYGQVDAKVTAHRTQKNNVNISRWSDEATDEQIEIFSEFNGELSKLGYDS